MIPGMPKSVQVNGVEVPVPVDCVVVKIPPGVTTERALEQASDHQLQSAMRARYDNACRGSNAGVELAKLVGDALDRKYPLHCTCGGPCTGNCPRGKLSAAASAVLENAKHG